MRVVTFNILHGRDPSSGRVRLDLFASAVRALAPDVLALQEVDRGQERSHGADLTAIAAEAMGAADHRFVAALVGTPGATWTAATGDEAPEEAAYGISLLSRFPAAGWQVVRLPAPRVAVPIWFRGQRLPVLVRDEPRVAVCAALETPTGPWSVATTHLSVVPGWNAWQLRRVARALARLPGPRLLMGDLNLGVGAAARATGLRPVVRSMTFPAHAPRRQLDHVLVEAGAPPARGRAVATGLSDHLALVADLDC